MQPVLERGSIDKPLTFDVGLIQLGFIPVCSPNTCMCMATEAIVLTASDGGTVLCIAYILLI